jgi:hypothetical protein
MIAMQKFAAAGFLILMPFGDCAPYDLILGDRRGQKYAIQVKTGRLRRGVIMFSCVSYHAHRNAPPTSYVGKIDAFGIYCPDNGEFYAVPIDAPAVTGSHGSLRVVGTKNNNAKPVHWAHHYRYDESSPNALKIRAAFNTGAAGED